MKDKNVELFLKREDAAGKLIEKLRRYKSTDSCVVSTSKNGIALSSLVSKSLGADLFFVPSKRVKHPGDPLKTLGVVSPEYSIMNELDRDIPQEFVYRRTRALQSKLGLKYRKVYSPISSRFEDRVVILVEECLETADKVLACVKTIREQNPRKIIIAAAVVNSRVIHDLIAEGDSVVFLNILSDKAIRNARPDFDPISDEEIEELMHLGRNTTAQAL
jgi:predicted phosphoribosyltransferase